MCWIFFIFLHENICCGEIRKISILLDWKKCLNWCYGSYFFFFNFYQTIQTFIEWLKKTTIFRHIYVFWLFLKVFIIFHTWWNENKEDYSGTSMIQSPRDQRVLFDYWDFEYLRVKMHTYFKLGLQNNFELLRILNYWSLNYRDSTVVCNVVYHQSS